MKAALASTLLALCALLVLWLDAPPVRYATSPCVYRPIYATSGPVDVLFAGSSRMQFGVDPFAVAEAIGRDPESTGVVNLGRQFGRTPGQVMQYLEDIEGTRGIVGPIVFEYADGVAPLPYEPSSVTFATLASDWGDRPAQWPHTELQGALNQLLRKVDLSIENALVGRAPLNAFAAPAARGGPRAQSCVTRPRAEEAELRRPAAYARAKRERERATEQIVGPGGTWRDLPDATWDLHEPLRAHKARYIDEIVRFGRQRDLPVFAVVIPAYLEPGVSPDVAADFTRRFGIPLLVPPLALREELYADAGYHYRDRVHLNRRGWRIFAAWLVSEMQAHGWAPVADAAASG